MAKRLISEMLDHNSASTDSDTTKRSKTEKSKNSGKSITALRPQRALRDTVENGNNTTEIQEEDGQLSKEKKKLAKKAKREAREAQRLVQSSEDGLEAGSTAITEEDKDLVKAARKAARKAKKKKHQGVTDGNTAHTISSVSSLSTSVATSSAPLQVKSSTSGPEPVSDPVGYQEDKSLAQLPQSEIDDFLSKNTMAIDDPKHNTGKLRPIIAFKFLPTTDKAQLAPFATFTAPTPIQAATWPFLLSGRDLIGVAETGSGKTLAFGVPCIRFIASLHKSQRKGIKAVIVSPTRELAVQIYEQLVTLASPAGLHVACVYGGVPKDPQVIACRKAHIVVATPGRLNDLIGDGSANLSQAKYVVLDEADRMLDKGFEEAIRQIITQTPKKRQTLMFTATWPPSVRELASTFMEQPVKVTIGDNVSGELRANVRITQLVEVVDPRAKEQRLLQLLKQYSAGKKKDDRILVFCLYKKEAVRIENFIQMKGFRVGGIHGDLSQEKRSASLAAFKEGAVPILVATDVAARGLDIPAVKVVINVTFPLTAEDYVHRIGRTGRAGKEGLAITFFTEHDKALSGSLINVLKAANQKVPEELMKFGTTVKKKGHDAYGAFYKDVDSMKQAIKITFD